MATFGGLSLEASASLAGAVLLLRNAAEESVTATVAPGIEVQIAEGARIVVVRGLTAQDAAAVISIAPEMANRALDLVSMRGTVTSTLEDPSSFHVAWWEDAGSRIVRLWSRLTMTMTLRAAGIGGGVTAPVPQPIWHESMRYFRMSQATDDQFDAFRNVFLGLESILDLIDPWIKGDRETDWILTALRNASSRVNLQDYLHTPASDPPDAIFQELYRTIRTAIFHAKAGRRVLLPQVESDRSIVADATPRYARLYLDLAEKVLGSKFAGGAGGGMTAATSQLMVDAATQNLNLAMTDDPTVAESSDTTLSPLGNPTLSLPTSRTIHSVGPYFATLTAETDVPTVLDTMSHIHRYGALMSDGQLAIVEKLEGGLDPSGFDRLEVAIAVRARNGGAGLKREYVT
ncbi:hypothetical protein [Geodermatophilus sp. FMUSA9-8]|uniref:hypothetical protein n=1 Tax=Geodermatophilus sp. FMUSA9-8 TaxID=3120155 RepID=UPI0030080A1C